LKETKVIHSKRTKKTISGQYFPGGEGGVKKTRIEVNSGGARRETKTKKRTSSGVRSYKMVKKKRKRIDQVKGLIQNAAQGGGKKKIPEPVVIKKC